MNNTLPTKVSAHKTSLYLRKSILSVAITTSLLSLSTLGYAAYKSDLAGNPVGEPIGDLELYQAANKPGATITMMIDLSSSMGRIVRATKRDGSAYYRLTDTANVYVPFSYGSTDSRADDNNGNSCIHNGRMMPFFAGSPIDTRYNDKAIAEVNNGVTDVLVGSTTVGTAEKIAGGVTAPAAEDISYTLSGCLPGQWVAASHQYTTVRDSNGFILNGTSWTDTNAFSWQANANATTNWQLTDLDRLGGLQHALIQALGEYTQADVDDPKVTDAAGNRITADKIGTYRIASHNILGIGSYGSAGHAYVNSGMEVAARPLTLEHRKKLIKMIDETQQGGWTPIAKAYAEASAYMLGTTTSPDTYSESGFNLAPVGPIRTATAYTQPGTDSKYQCYGKGIYFLTDGYPNKSNKGVKDMISAMMPNGPMSNWAAGANLTQSDVSYDNKQSGWKFVGRLAKSIRQYDDPNNDIKTATVGFGSSFDVFGDPTKALRQIVNKDGNVVNIHDCALAAPVLDAETNDARNLCKWGMQESYTYNATDDKMEVLTGAKRLGGGGFTYAKNAADIQNSLVAFFANTENNITTKPSGTILIPDDPFKGNTVTPHAYLPVLQPAVGTDDAIWSGNLKKYNTANGTLYGQSNKLLYGAGGSLNEDSADMWTTGTISTTGNGKVQSGGYYAQLKSPSTASSTGLPDFTRNVFVESYKAGNNGGFTNVGVTAAGQATGFNSLDDSVYGANQTDSRRSHRKILQYLGFTIPVGSAALDTTATSSHNMITYQPSSDQRVLGATIHSKPALASYSVKVDTSGKISTVATDRDEYLFFGTMDGTLHMVDANSGEEKWALILNEMFRKQSHTLVPGATGELKFGVDAPWLISSKYNYAATTASSTATVKLFSPTNATGGVDDSLLNTSNYVAMAAYGGFRLGARGLYALDLSNRDSPKMLFKITADHVSSSPSSDAPLLQRSGAIVDPNKFRNIGHLWSKVSKARINASSAVDSKPLDVIIFGGGYDTKYELPTFVPDATRTLGSSLYIVDAKTGQHIWDWENTENHSIVGGVTVLDRDNDGYFDHLYFADLGGNVFRADFKNTKDDPFNEVNVVKIFEASQAIPAADKHLAYRFYQKPVVSFYEDESHNLFGLVNVASGDRSSPLANVRTKHVYANKIYGIIDKEVTSPSLLVGGTTNQYPASISATTSFNQSDLAHLSGKKLANATESTNAAHIAHFCDSAQGGVSSSTCKKKAKVISYMMQGSKKGWFYNLDRFYGYSGIKNIKAVGQPVVISSSLYVSLFESSAVESTGDACSASVRGQSEVQLYCLPYGVCAHDSSVSGTGGFIPSGAGIQELTLGAQDKDNTDSKVLIGTRTLTDQANDNDISAGEDSDKNLNKSLNGGTDVTANNENGYNNVAIGDEQIATSSTNTDDVKKNFKDAKQIHGDPEIPIKRYKERYQLVPQQWYEVLD